MDMMTVRRFWMSFVNDEQPKGEKFAGACIVEVTAEDAAEALVILEKDFPNHLDGAEWIAAATRKAWLLGINPGGQVASWDITDVPVPEGVDMVLDRLMDRTELEKRGFEPVSEADVEQKQMARRYRVTLYADVLLEDGEPQYTAKELEKHLIKVLRKAEPECDLEVMDYEDVEA